METMQATTSVRLWGGVAAVTHCAIAKETPMTSAGSHASFRPLHTVGMTSRDERTSIARNGALVTNDGCDNVVRPCRQRQLRW